MRKRRLIVVFVTSAIVVAIGGTALAKGPASATITGPGIDQPIEVIDADYFDSDYSDHVKELMQQTGLWFGASGGTRIPAEPAGDLGPAYTLTWINSSGARGSVEERTIRQLLYLHAEGGPVIHTPPQVGLEGWGPDVIGWFTAPDGLRDTLAALGVPVSAQQSNSGVPISNKTAATSAEAEPTDGLRYLAMGLGLVITLIWVVWRRTTITEQ